MFSYISTVLMSQPIQVGRGREGGWSESRARAAEVILSNRDVVVLFVFIEEVLVILEIYGLFMHGRRLLRFSDPLASSVGQGT